MPKVKPGTSSPTSKTSTQLKRNMDRLPTANHAALAERYRLAQAARVIRQLEQITQRQNEESEVKAIIESGLVTGGQVAQ